MCSMNRIVKCPMKNIDVLVSIRNIWVMLLLHNRLLHEATDIETCKFYQTPRKLYIIQSVYTYRVLVRQHVPSSVFRFLADVVRIDSTVQ
jgi:hypothetical protein